MTDAMFEAEIWDCDVLKKDELIDDRWRVVGYLGQGGGGAVYRVAELDGRRTGALKIFCGELERDVHHGAERIRQESEIISKLEIQPGMPQFYGRGEHNGRPYLIRDELTPVEPEDIPSDDEGRTKFILHLLYSLKSLHANGWVHCDIKPWNIAMSKSGLYVLIDFGSAHRIEEGEHVYNAGQTINTINGIYGRSGTIGYDAPENSFTPARDIYAVGHLIRDCFERDVPLEWGMIINKCISNNPNYRYCTVDALIADVQKLLAGKLRDEAYWPLRVARIKKQREAERSLAEAEEVPVELQDILKKDESLSTDDLTVLRIYLTRTPRCHFVLRDDIELGENTILIIEGEGILTVDIAGPASSVVVIRSYAALNNLTDSNPPENDLTYVMVGPGSYLNFPNVNSDKYRAFFPGRRRILRDLDASTSFRFGGPPAFAHEEQDVLAAIEDSRMPSDYKGVLKRFFKGETFTVLPPRKR